MVCFVYTLGRSKVPTQIFWSSGRHVVWFVRNQPYGWTWQGIIMIIADFYLHNTAMNDPLHGTIGQLVGYYITIGNSATAFIIILGSISTNTGKARITFNNIRNLTAYSRVYQKDNC